jgi:thiamine biosynthesis protein ThiS
VRIIVNGEAHSAADGSTIENLVEQLALKAERLAVELNGEVVRRAEWAQATLSEGDRVEIVHFVGGGSHTS